MKRRSFLTRVAGAAAALVLGPVAVEGRKWESWSESPEPGVRVYPCTHDTGWVQWRVTVGCDGEITEYWKKVGIP